jgi:geranylgeranyl pyrophosphate synthase
MPESSLAEHVRPDANLLDGNLLDGRTGLSNAADRVAAAHAGAASSPEDFGVQLEAWRVRMEHALAARLPAATTVPARLHEAMRYSVLGGGKRIRPALLFATAKTLGLTEDQVEAAACAIELIHVYSLVHDDLPAMDDDDLRRGRPTCHKAFDEATAVLVGDALQPLAFQLLARDPSLPASPAIRLALVDMLSVASGTFGMAGGQAIDLAVKGQQPDITEVEDMHARKTGAVIRASVLMAALCVPDLQTRLYDALNDYATAIGLAFQIQDDLLDVLGDVSTLGKATGADRERDKPTHPAIIGIEASQERVHLLHRQALDSLEPFAERAAPLRSLANWLLSRRY